MKWTLIQRSVGAKIALATSLALSFVTVIFLAVFLLVDIHFLSKFNLIQLLISFFCLFVFVESLLVILATNLFVGRPLQKLTEVMKRAEEGNFLIRAQGNTNDELGDLSNCFNTMLARITDLEARKIETERELVMAQENLKYKAQLEERAQALQKAHETLETSLKDLSLLYSTSQLLSRTLELGEFFHTVKTVLTENLNIREFSLLFYNDTREWLEVKAAAGFEDSQRIQGMKFLPGEGICGLCALEGRTLYVEDLSAEPRYLHYKGEKKGEGAFASIPLMVSGMVAGVLNVSHSRVGAFNLTDLRSLESVANQIAVAYERTRLYMKIKELSVTDELTGISNRRHFQQMLRMEWKRAERFSRSLSLLMIDVDHFKKYNDTHGHVKGDLALKNLARILSENVREVDTIARFGGEEFVILLADTAFGDAMKVAEKIKNLVATLTQRALQAGGADFPLTVSIGVSTFPQLVSTEEELLNTADSALYEAKRGGRNRVMGYLPVEEEGETKLPPPFRRTLAV